MLSHGKQLCKKIHVSTFIYSDIIVDKKIVYCYSLRNLSGKDLPVQWQEITVKNN